MYVVVANARVPPLWAPMGERNDGTAPDVVDPTVRRESERTSTSPTLVLLGSRVL